MQKNSSRLTVFFEDPFWVAVYERSSGGRLEACKITFGAEPCDQEVYEYLLARWHTLHFSPPVQADARGDKSIGNPKRRQRESKRQVAPSGVGTKAQQALKLQQDEGRLARQKSSRQQKEQQQERKYQLRQEKRRQKHRGH